MASYPTSIKSFTTKTDGPSSIISASHINDLQDEVAAIETDIVTGPFTLTCGQISFPSTQSASSGANVLDDYEEGEWTPAISGTGGASGQTYTTQVGRYIKVGRVVTATFNITLSAEGTITDSALVTGLPFPAVTLSGYRASAAVSFASLQTSWVNVIAVLPSGQSSMSLLGCTAAAMTNNTPLTASDIDNDSVLEGTIVYFSAS